MREIQASEITRKVKEAILEISFHTPKATLERLKAALSSEPSEAAKAALRDIIENREIASRERVPMCQDTGMAIIFVELGEKVQIIGGSLKSAIEHGVREGYATLRKSVVAEPLFGRKNTGDNTPAIVHIDLVDGDRLKLSVGAKGFGAENMSWARESLYSGCYWGWRLFLPWPWAGLRCGSEAPTLRLPPSASTKAFVT